MVLVCTICSTTSSWLYFTLDDSIPTLVLYVQTNIDIYTIRHMIDKNQHNYSKDIYCNLSQIEQLARKGPVMIASGLD